MNPRISRRSVWLAALIFSMSVLPQTASATLVEFQTVMGDFQVNLYDNATPATVANFLDYVSNGDYNNTIFHRSVPDFIVQAGGFTFDTLSLQIVAIPARPSVVNEPVFANVRGTIAMAKQDGDPNSASNQWFFNLSDDNTGNLDNQNGGFTAFGEVVGNGMTVVDAIAALPIFSLGGALTNIPLRGNTSNNPLDASNFVIITKILVIDSAVDTAGAAGLTPTPTTAGSGSGGGTTPTPGGGGGGGGGGSGVFFLLGLLLAYRHQTTSRLAFSTD